MHYLLKAFALTTEYEFMNAVENHKEVQNLIEEFLPRVVNHTALELTRCNIGDIVMIMDTYFKLWNKCSF